MRRRIIGTCLVLSALLSVLLAGAAAWSHWRPGGFVSVRNHNELPRMRLRACVRGFLVLQGSDHGMPQRDYEGPLRSLPEMAGYRFYRSDYGWQVLGFAYRRIDQDRHGGTSWHFQVPLWVVASVLAVPPALWLLSWSRVRRRRRRGACVGCGYLLIGLTSDRCPECGRAITSPSPAA